MRDRQVCEKCERNHIFRNYALSRFRQEEWKWVNDCGWLFKMKANPELGFRETRWLMMSWCQDEQCPYYLEHFMITNGEHNG